MSNNATHENCLLNEAEGYIPSYAVNNAAYEGTDACPEYLTRSDEDGNILTLRTTEQVTHYHVNMAAMIQIGNWLDYLREMGVYDNTRIIIASDHGRKNEQYPEEFFDEDIGPEVFQAVLLVKDFNATEYTVSEELMTNADVPTLATQEIIANPVNPFTGKPINSDAKYAGPLHVFYSSTWMVNINNGTTFLDDGNWYRVQDDVREGENWEKMDAKPN